MKTKTIIEVAATLALIVTVVAISGLNFVM